MVWLFLNSVTGAVAYKLPQVCVRKKAEGMSLGKGVCVVGEGV